MNEQIMLFLAVMLLASLQPAKSARPPTYDALVHVLQQFRAGDLTAAMPALQTMASVAAGLPGGEVEVGAILVHQHIGAGFGIMARRLAAHAGNALQVR